MKKLPISVIMITKNEAVNIVHSLPPLVANFGEVHVVDSNSSDETVALATERGAKVHNFTWNGQYPKKKQWALDNIPLKHKWVFFVDADEIITDDFITALTAMDMSADGYFIASKMVWNGTTLNHGMINNKLALFKPAMFHFPIVNDL